jgi:AraC-like DNA-binding protein
MLAAAEGRITASDRVRMALPELLNEGEPSGQRVAQRLSMSWRTLQRRLEASGTTFRTLLDETRFRLAREWLNHTAVPIKVVAARLGYADERAFDRAFHRWASITPMQYRRRATSRCLRSGHESWSQNRGR